jgi:hypothetical protein
MFGCVMFHWTSAESATKTEAASPPKRAMRTPAAFLPLKPQPAHHRGGEDAQGDRRPKLLLTLDFTAFEASQTTSGGPPDHALRLTLAVRLVFWFAVDVRASGAGKLVVCVNIIDMHDKTRARHTCCDTWRIELMFRCHAVQPDRRRARAHFTVNGLTIGVTGDASRLEAKRLHEEVVCRLDVFVNQEWNYAFKRRHKGSFRRPWPR